MTGQISDSVKFQGGSYVLTACEGGALFLPVDFNLRPMASSTASWRGFRSEYEVSLGSLFLQSLNINHRSEDQDAEGDSNEERQKIMHERQLDVPPPINGKAAEYDPEGLVGPWIYHNLELPLSFTGMIEIANYFLSHSDFQGGHPQSIHFDEVIRMTFRDGFISNMQDVSAEFAFARRNKNNPESFYPL